MPRGSPPDKTGDLISAKPAGRSAQLRARLAVSPAKASPQLSRGTEPGIWTRRGYPWFPEVLPAGSPLEAGRARRMAVAAALGVPVSRGPGLPQSFAKLPGWQALPLGLSPRSWGCRAVPCRGRSGRAGPRQRCRPAPGTRCTPALAVALHAIHLHLAPWNRECVGHRGSPAGKRSPGLLSSSVSL